MQPKDEQNVALRSKTDVPGLVSRDHYKNEINFVKDKEDWTPSDGHVYGWEFLIIFNRGSWIISQKIKQ